MTDTKKQDGSDSLHGLVEFCMDCEHAMPRSPRNYYCTERKFGVGAKRKACQWFKEDKPNS